MSAKKRQKKNAHKSRKIVTGELFEIHESIRINNATLRRWKNLANTRFVETEIARKEAQIEALHAEIESIRFSHSCAHDKVASIEAKQRELNTRAARITNQSSIDKMRHVLEMLRATQERMNAQAAEQTATQLTQPVPLTFPMSEG